MLFTDEAYRVRGGQVQVPLDVITDSEQHNIWVVNTVYDTEAALTKSWSHILSENVIHIYNFPVKLKLLTTLTTISDKYSTLRPTK